MATAADKKRWDDLHAALAKADAATEEFERGLRAKYGMNFQSSWLSSGQRAKLQQLRDRAGKVGDKIVELLVRVSPRGDDWLSGVPSWWITRELAWEDVIRPRSEPLSVVPPEAWGSSAGRRAIDRMNEGRMARERTMRRRVMSRRQPSLPGFPDIPEELDIEIPDMPMWTQIGGDMNPGAHGGILARSDGDALELLEIQPVRAHVGDSEAADVGFPFWTREAYYELSDLQDPKNVQEALQFIGMDRDDFEDLEPTNRALVIAEALLGYGTGVDEGQSGWSDDVVPDQVKWMTGKIAGAEYIADEDDEFVRDVLLADLDIDHEAFGPDENEPESGLKVVVSGAGTVEITEWTDIEAANGEEQPEGEEILREDAQVDLSELMDPNGKHRGSYSGDDRSVGLRELAEMDDEAREEAIVAAAIAYTAYYGGDETFVDAIGD